MNDAPSFLLWRIRGDFPCLSQSFSSFSIPSPFVFLPFSLPSDRQKCLSLFLATSHLLLLDVNDS